MITGRGTVSPLGVGVKNHQEGLLSGRPAIGISERLSSVGFRPSSVGEIPEEALKSSVSLIPQKQKKLMNRAGILAAIASFFAAEEAALGKADIDPTRIGIFLATWFTFYGLRSFIQCLAASESQREPGVLDAGRANVKCLQAMNPVDSLKLLPNLTAGHLAIFHRAQGCCRVIADGWTGGLLAVAQAAHAIREGDLDLALAGGSEAPLEEGIFCDLCTLEVVARDGGEPGPICRPFDRGRRGIVLGEGAGMVVLEERDHADRRGAPLYGEIVGSASSAPAQAGRREEALRLSVVRALQESGLEPSAVDFVHANGDSSYANDQAEWRALSAVFCANGAVVPVTATKSLHGHLLSAAGAVELISSLIMLERGIIPPIANCYCPDPACNLDLVRGSPREKAGMNTALLNAMGLFGEAASLVIRR